MDSPVEKRSRPSPAAMNLYMSAKMAVRLEFAHLGPEAIGKQPLMSPRVVKTFLNSFPEISAEFLARAGADREALIGALDAPHEAEPDPPPPTLAENATEEQRQSYEIFKEMDDKRREKGEPAPFSHPLRKAMRSAKRRANEEGVEIYGASTVIASIFETESIAKEALNQVANPDALAGALEWLRNQPDPENAPTFLQDRGAQMNELMDRMWPKIREEANGKAGDKLRSAKDAAYEKNPERYETPLDIAAEFANKKAPEDHRFSWQSGVCLHAATNEARIRRAPETTLDHMFLALLRDGTDTAVFLDRHSVDRGDWSAQIDAALPRFEEGPRFPPNDRGLGMSIDSNLNYKFRPLPEGLELANLTPEEREKYVVRLVDQEHRFTDLTFIRKVPEEPKTIAHRLFTEGGITKDQLDAEIRSRQTGDPDWWRKAPDLIARLHAEREEGEPKWYALTRICSDSAQYEARMRGGSQVTFDDFLVALLTPGTDLWALLDSPESVRAEIDALRPREGQHLMFPPPDRKARGGLLLLAEKFSDLLYVQEAFGSPPISPGLALLESRGVDRDTVIKRLDDLGVGLRHRR